MQDQNQSPFNALPPVVVALVIVILGIEIVFSLGARGLIGGPEAVGWRLSAQLEYGFEAKYFWWMWESST